ncbi:HAD-IB family phosphatase [Amnibacterium kyonggiense]|uniref:HAD superfamily phosphoserine phosphatase-like hydrolase n=1 Tax=Amnibacterium kyonggiense TaxID=595671 RepID=A0A4V3EAJ3_9MICO|nr:HAD-IB family phosphatase [Amnibacterium kyonggiense]TDS75658.1 HAD superfamily phosphoserine phosphatase-like hydrolase [Amnibacterium kyonggiense]
MTNTAGAGTGAEPESPVGRLSGHVLLTGGTGFVGQAVLERLLVSHPDTRISMLVRGKTGQSAADRVRKLLSKPVFKPWREAVGREEAARIFAERVTAVEGSLDAVPELPADLDVVIHSASTVSFDPPIDEAFATNVGGASGIYSALRATGADPHVVHVSTCYVGGMRKGVLPEASLDHDADWRIEWEAAAAARQRVELRSREPGVLRGLMLRARAEHGKEGPRAVARAAEDARIDWVKKRLVTAGRARAQSLGWTDVYTLTKALAERAAEELWGAEHRLSVVRPSVIESALEHPFPGWIDGFKVADPLIIAFGRGQLPDFPGVPDSVLDIIPVDFVVNAILAAAATPPPATEPRYLHIASGASNPLPFHEMYRNVHEYFTANPIPDTPGAERVPTWQFPGDRRVERAIRRAEVLVGAANTTLDRLPSTPRLREWQRTMGRRERDVHSLRQLSDLYRAYVGTELIFDDRNARTLNARIPADRPTEGFDVTRIDWRDFMQRVHVPAITQLMRVFSRGRGSTGARSTEPKALEQRTDVVAVFDLEGTVVESNIVQQRLWVLRAQGGEAAAAAEAGSIITRLPSYLAAERRDRGEFLRSFLRRYAGMPASRLEAAVRGGYTDQLVAHTSSAALQRVREHRAAGHRTVLVTGSIGVLAEPLAELFDEVIAGTMHEEQGVLTGYLGAPPLVDEARGAWLAQYAERGGYDLAASYAYGDSVADLPWLSLVGNATAVNPDARLARAALKRRWPIVDWPRGGVARTDLTS